MDLTGKSDLSAVVAQLKSRKGLPPLTPAHIWHPEVDEQIAALSLDVSNGGDPIDRLSMQACQAALHLWNDSLDHAHGLVEHMDSPTGSMLHGIMHRREGDFSNAKYWFHRAGDHPAYPALQAGVVRFLEGQQISATGNLGDPLRIIRSQGIWNPILFVNAVEIHEIRINGNGDSESRLLLENIQHLELEAVRRYLAGLIRVPELV